MKKNYLWLTGLLAVLGATLTGIGEWLLFYSPEMGYGAASGYQNLLHISPEKIQGGFLMGVLGAPIYLLGYWHVSHMLRLSPKWHWIMMTLAVLAFVVGAVWFAANVYIALIVQASFSAGGETAALMQVIIRKMELLSLPLLGIVRLGVLGVSMIMVVKIAKRDTYYPVWAIGLLPFMFVIYMFGLFFTAPNVGNYLIPSALNIAHVFFFLFSAFWGYKASQESK